MIIENPDEFMDSYTFNCFSDTLTEKDIEELINEFEEEFEY